MPILLRLVLLLFLLYLYFDVLSLIFYVLNEEIVINSVMDLFVSQNMWDLTPDTDLLMELPEAYTFETALADLIVSC